MDSFNIESLYVNAISGKNSEIIGQFKDYIKKVTIPILYAFDPDQNKIIPSFQVETLIMVKNGQLTTKSGVKYTIIQNYILINRLIDNYKTQTQYQQQAAKTGIRHWYRISAIMKGLTQMDTFPSGETSSFTSITNGFPESENIRIQITQRSDYKKTTKFAITFNGGENVQGTYINPKYLPIFLNHFCPEFYKQQIKHQNNDYLYRIVQYNVNLYNEYITREQQIQYNNQYQVRQDIQQIQEERKQNEPAPIVGPSLTEQNIRNNDIANNTTPRNSYSDSDSDQEEEKELRPDQIVIQQIMYLLNDQFKDETVQINQQIQQLQQQPESLQTYKQLITLYQQRQEIQEKVKRGVLYYISNKLTNDIVYLGISQQDGSSLQDQAFTRFQQHKQSTMSVIKEHAPIHIHMAAKVLEYQRKKKFSQVTSVMIDEVFQTNAIDRPFQTRDSLEQAETKIIQTLMNIPNITIYNAKKTEVARSNSRTSRSQFTSVDRLQQKCQEIVQIRQQLNIQEEQIQLVDIRRITPQISPQVSRNHSIVREENPTDDQNEQTDQLESTVIQDVPITQIQEELKEPIIQLQEEQKESTPIVQQIQKPIKIRCDICGTYIVPTGMKKHKATLKCKSFIGSVNRKGNFQ